MKLTPARKSIISQYLFSTISRWAAVFGIVNLFAILISLGYVFFILPKKASDEAQILLRQEISGQLTDLRKTLDELNKLAGRVNERSETTLSASERIANAQSTAESSQKELQKRIAALDAQLQAAEKSNVTAIAKFVADFNENEEAKGLITRLNVVEQSANAAVRYGDIITIKSQRYGTPIVTGGEQVFMKVHKPADDEKWAIEKVAK